jgi:serine/threonine protein kinase/tetratricopeptide (TPR) repeat protein
LTERGYRLTKLLGRGGFGSVYAAERTSDHARVAIKLALRTQPSAIDSLQREAASLRAVGPPHVPSVFEAGQITQGFYVAMERLAAQTLAERMLELGGPAPLELFGSIAYAMLTPIEAVHERGLVHCDLKPENIFIVEHGYARLIDFGLSRSLVAPVGELETTDAVDDAGTAEYMSPEQCDGLPCDRSSDIYSVGIVLYELLSGAPPFWGQATDVREAQRSRRPPPISRKVRCPPELVQLIRRCLAKDRMRRFSDIPALRNALDHALHSRLPSLRPQSMRPSIIRLPRRSLPLKLAAAPKEKRAMGLVFFASSQGVGNVQSTVTSSGGQIVHTSGTQYVAAFGHDVGENPARVALLAAHRMLAASIAQRLLVDVATVSVQNRPDGSRRIISALLTNADRFPTADDPVGVSFTSAAFDVLPDLELRPLTRRPDRYTLSKTQELSAFAAQLSPLIGRDDTLGELWASAAQAKGAAEPALVTVLAPAGYGRTHLAGFAAHELGRAAQGFDVIWLSAREGSVAQVLPELLRRVLDLPKTQPENKRALLISRLGDTGEATWAAVAHALDWLEAAHPDVRRLAAAPGALRFASARAAGDALWRRAADKPIAVLLDDAHLADEATLDALEYATMKGARASIWVCVLAPLSFAGSRPSWGSRAAHAQRIVLSELAPKHAVELARRLLLPAEYTPEAVLLKLAGRTQGVPRLLVELVRGLKRDGFVRKSERGTGYYLAADELHKLPDLPIVQWNATREIEALPQQLAGHARLASVLGSSFTAAELEAVISVLDRGDVPEDMRLDASVGVQRLVDSGVLVREPSGLCDFRQDILRDMIYKLVPDAQRTRLHRAAFEAYCSLDIPESMRLPRLAMHAARCGEREFAAIASLELARRCLRAQAYLEAEAAYSGALDNLSETDERAVEAARGRGLMRWRLGRHEGALVDLRKARELARASAALELEQEIMLDEATVLDWAREFSASVALVRAVEAMNAPLSPLLRARLAMGIARCHMRQGETEATIRMATEAAQLAAALGDEGYETRIIAELMVATFLAVESKLEAAERSFAHLIAEAESRGDLHHVSAALGNRALLWHGLRDVERLFADLGRAAQLGRELGEAPLEYVGVYNLAESEYVLGRLHSAREHAQRMLELSRQQFGEINREVSVSELLLARIALYDDDLPGARALARNIRERIARGRSVGDAEAELEPSPEVLLQMVELASSAAPLSTWRTLCERVRSLELQPMELVELLERAALASAQLGEWTYGRELYREALDLLTQKPSLINERVMRRLGPIFGEQA